MERRGVEGLLSAASTSLASGEHEAAVRECGGALRLAAPIELPAAFWLRANAFDKLGRPDLALSDGAAAKKGAADASVRGAYAESPAEFLDRVRAAVRRNAEIEEKQEELEPGAEGLVELPPPFLVLRSALWYRLALALRGGESAVRIAPAEGGGGGGSKVTVGVKALSEYGKWRRSDFEGALPMALAARLLKASGTGDSSEGSGLQLRGCVGAIEPDGRGTLSLELVGEWGVRQRVLELEVYATGAERVIGVVASVSNPNPLAAVEPDAGADAGADAGDASESLVAHVQTEQEEQQEEEKRAGTRHVITVGGSQLHITELLGASVGLRLWDCALATLALMRRREATRGFSAPTASQALLGWVRGKRVIELGSGTGLVGLAFWAMGAEVTLTDQPSVLPLTASNVSRTLKANEGAEGVGPPPVVKELVWGSENLEVWGFEPPYDLVLASDVAYDHRAMAALVQTLAALAHAEQGTPAVLLAFRCSDVLSVATLKAERKFFGMLAAEFVVAECEQPQPCAHVVLYELSKRKPK